MYSVQLTTANHRMRESIASRMDRCSFILAFGFIGVTAGLLLVAPTVIVLITSFTDAYSLKFPPSSYSLRWYEALWTDSPEIISAAVLSFKIATYATVISTVLAVAAGLALARSRNAWARILDSVLMSPLMLPTLALGLALLMLFNLSEQPLSAATLVVGHVAITSPYILRTTSASLMQVDSTLIESARTLGASPWFSFQTVTLPLIARGIASGAFIAFMASFDNVAISLFLSDARSEVLPIRLWHIIESSLDVRAAAVSGVLIAATAVLMLLMQRFADMSRHFR